MKPGIRNGVGNVGRGRRCWKYGFLEKGHSQSMNKGYPVLKRPWPHDVSMHPIVRVILAWNKGTNAMGKKHHLNFSAHEIFTWVRSLRVAAKVRHCVSIRDVLPTILPVIHQTMSVLLGKFLSCSYLMVVVVYTVFLGVHLRHCETHEVSYEFGHALVPPLNDSTLLS